MNLKTLLDVEIEEQRNKLAKLEPGNKEYSDAVDALTKLMDRRIEIEKVEQAETQSEKQLAEDRKTRWGKIIVDAGLGVAGIAVTIWGAKASFKFEETGSICAQTGKKFMDRLFRR